MELKFSFESLRLLESHFKLNTEFVPRKDEPTEISYEISLSHKKENKSITVIICVSSANKNQPFVFDTTRMGIFDFSRMPGRKELDRIVHLNCASIMFPYLREIVADLTRRADIGAFHRDPLNFVRLYEDRKKSPAHNKNTASEGAGQ